MLAGQQAAEELSDEDIANEIVTLLFAVSMAASTRVTRIPRSYRYIIIVARNRKRVRRVSRLLFTYYSYNNIYTYI